MRLAILLAASLLTSSHAQAPSQPPAQGKQVRGYWVDPASGLMWADKDNGKDLSWKKAINYCRNLRLAGHSDWRLATLAELGAIFDRNADAPGLAGSGKDNLFTYHVKGNLFLTGDEWSSERRKDDRGHPSGYDWYYDFNEGRSDNEPSGFPYSSSLVRALCVRGSGDPLGRMPPTQAQIPSTQIDPPPQTSVPKDAPFNPKLPTLFIVGDSTARNGADLGWGDHLAHYLDTSKINIANRAIAGRSSRTYINEGHWTKTLAEMKPGDFMLFQMGHNDGGDLGGAKPRGEIKGIGDESQDIPQTAGLLAGQTETVHTYGWYVRKYVTEARARGVTPILLTITIRNIWKDSHIERDMGYTTYIHQLSDELHVPIADMATLEADYLESIGPEKTALLFPIDHTHTSAAGAEMNAKMVTTALKNIQSPVADFVKP